MHGYEIIITLIISLLIIHGESKMKPFIAHGWDAKIVDFSFSAHIHVKCELIKFSFSWSCGASIVNQDVLLTAGHCLCDCSNASAIVISYGHENTLKAADISVSKFTVYEGYGFPSKLDNDIALLRTKRSLKFNANVGRVALMPNPPYNEKALIAGWGLIDEEKSISSPELQFTEQYVLKKEDCLKLLRILREGTICAQNKNCMLSSSGYPTKGDSGSALVVRGYIQIGLVSYKVPRLSRSLIVYTDTGYYYNWITKTAAKLCED